MNPRRSFKKSVQKILLWVVFWETLVWVGGGDSQGFLDREPKCVQKPGAWGGVANVIPEASLEPCPHSLEVWAFVGFSVSLWKAEVNLTLWSTSPHNWLYFSSATYPAWLPPKCILMLTSPSLWSKIMVKHCLVIRLIKHGILPVTEAALQMLFAIRQGPALISLPLTTRNRVCCGKINIVLSRPPVLFQLWPVSCHCHVRSLKHKGRGMGEKGREAIQEGKERFSGRRKQGRYQRAKNARSG